jgi:hypothetical protein
MTAVWIMSYLFASMCGGIAVLAAAWYLINRSERKQASNNLHADNARNLTSVDLSVGNLYEN